MEYGKVTLFVFHLDNFICYKLIQLLGTSYYVVSYVVLLELLLPCICGFATITGYKLLRESDLVYCICFVHWFAKLSTEALRLMTLSL